MLKKICGALLLTLFFSFPSQVIAAEQDVTVNEVMYDPPGSDTDHEWVELYNSGSDPVIIIGGSSVGSWRINDASNHTLSTTAVQGEMTISAGGFAVIAKDTVIFLSDYPGFSGNLIQSSISLNNTLGTISLRIGSSGSLWGEFSYQSTQGGNEDGNSLQKTADSTIIAALATPGTENAALPAPTSTPTPTDSPTPTKTPTPTKSPTKTPTPKPTNSPTPSVTNIPTVTKIISKTPTSTKTISPSQNKDVLANSTKSSANNFEEPKKEDKNDNTQKNNNFLPIIFISVGIAFLLACAIVIAYPFIVRFKREKLDG